MASREALKILLEKYVRGECSPEELQAFEQWFQRLDKIARGGLPDDYFGDEEAYLAREYQKLLRLRDSKPLLQPKIRKLPAWSKIAAAAAVLIMTGAGIYFYSLSSGIQQKTVIQTIKDKAAGYDGAILTLADGSTVILDSAGSGAIAQQGSAQVVSSNGALAYKDSKAADTAIIYNTLSTPRARQYRLTLSDGTKVWLNAASSIRYPIAFNGKERIVEITGEAYFEVVHNAAKPFKVVAGSVAINDIGTQFNVMAYSDEPAIKATLLEGAIKVVHAQSEKILKPDEQAQITGSRGIKVVQLPDAQNTIAWKNGVINFSSADIATLFRQLARWYNVDIVYEGKVPQGHITGDISRRSNLSAIIEELAYNHIHCRLEGNRLVVSPD